MRVSTPALIGSTGALCDAHAKPATKAKVQGDLLAKSQGRTLAAEVMATVLNQSRAWGEYAQRIIAGTIEFRSAFVEQLTRDVKAMNKANTLDDTVEGKIARKRVNSALTQAKMMKAIAVGFNAGATLEGLCLHARTFNPKAMSAAESVARGDHKLIGYTVITEYARLFGDAKAGKTPDDFWTVVSKFLDRTLPAEDDAVGVALHEKMVKLLNSTKA